MSKYLELTPSSTPSKLSGGTIEFLPNERKKATFSVNEMIDILNGGQSKTKRRKFIQSVLDKVENYTKKYNFSRSEYLKFSVKEFIRTHTVFKDFKPTKDDMLIMSGTTNGGSINNSFSIFAPTILNMGNSEQINFWIPKIHSFEIVGSYAQTELGHGSNVRGIETTAFYDKNTEEFILNSPTLTSTKWWPGALGKVANYCIVYAQLILDGKEKGVTPFIMQIRDEKHKPLRGVTLGDLGNKIGEWGNDTGFMVLDNVRIPRENMLRKYKEVTKEGKLIDVVKADPKVHYSTMMFTRAAMINGSAYKLSNAATVAIRYSCVRKQGFTSNLNLSFKQPEDKIIDHFVQQYRCFKQLSTAYALKFIGMFMIDEVKKFESQPLFTDLKDLAVTSAGLKSLCTYISIQGVEDLRKCCGGNGYLLSSGIGAVASDYLLQVTSEGDFIVLSLLTAKNLVSSLRDVLNGKKLEGVSSYLNPIGENHFNLEKIRPKEKKYNSQFFEIDNILILFRFRAIERLIYATQDLDAILKNGKKPEEAWNLMTIEMSKVSQFHCYYLIVKNFSEQIAKIQSLQIKNLLTTLFFMFTLTNFLDENWSGYFLPNEFRLIQDCIKECMKIIRPNCVALVDSFDFPDNVLRSTIGKYDGNVYEALFDSAQKSILNRVDPFDGFEEYLKPHINKNFLRLKNKKMIVNSKF